MRVGFTGTRKGMTDEQKDAVRLFLLTHPIQEVHHGDCVGGDADFHAIVRAFLGTSVHVCIHPGMDSKGKSPSRAYCEEDGKACTVCLTFPYLSRNKDIVLASDHLLATPGEFKERRRGSGTWTTIRFGLKHVPVSIVWPDGTIQRRAISTP